MISIKLTSVMVDDQAKALDFYTNVLGFAVKRDIPMGEARWLTVVAGRPNCFLGLRAAWPSPRAFRKRCSMRPSTFVLNDTCGNLIPLFQV
jgi:catechol 2,3-dioxygenase-like lactoylglutathione lyase family enzyme